MKRNKIEKALLNAVFQLSNQLQTEGNKLTGELTLKQWSLLLLLYKGNTAAPSVHDLALSMGVTRQSIKKMVGILERKGYLSVAKSPSDNRALCISPTPKADAFFSRNKAPGPGFMSQVFIGLKKEDLSITLQVLQQIQQNLTTISGKSE